MSVLSRAVDALVSLVSSVDRVADALERIADTAEALVTTPPTSDKEGTPNE